VLLVMTVKGPYLASSSAKKMVVVPQLMRRLSPGLNSFAALRPMRIFSVCALARLSPRGLSWADWVAACAALAPPWILRRSPWSEAATGRA
jgi:hypothetical protein